MCSLDPQRPHHSLLSQIHNQDSLAFRPRLAFESVTLDRWIHIEASTGCPVSRRERKGENANKQSKTTTKNANTPKHIARRYQKYLVLRMHGCPKLKQRIPALKHPSLTQVIGEHSSVQFSRSVVSNSLRPHESQHARPPCPSSTPGVYSNSCPLSRWSHPAISSSVIPFSSWPQSLPASGSFPMNQLFAWGSQSIGVSASASVLPMITPLYIK